MSDDDASGSSTTTLVSTKPTGAPSAIAIQPACWPPVTGTRLYAAARSPIARSSPHALLHIFAIAAACAAEVDTAELEARITERLDAAIDDVLDSTERLAAEQARYEIRFRADLAELAERIRRPST